MATDDSALARVQADVDKLADKVAAIDEVLNGTQTARHTGMEYRFEQMETEVRRADLQRIRDDVLLLNDNKIENGRVVIEVMQRDVTGIKRLVWSIGSAVVMAIVSALLGLVITK